MLINGRQVKITEELAQALQQLSLTLFEERIDQTYKPSQKGKNSKF